MPFKAASISACKYFTPVLDSASSDWSGVLIPEEAVLRFTVRETKIRVPVVDAAIDDADECTSALDRRDGVVQQVRTNFGNAKVQLRHEATCRFDLTNLRNMFEIRYAVELDHAGRNRIRACRDHPEGEPSLPQNIGR